MFKNSLTVFLFILVTLSVIFIIVGNNDINYLFMNKGYCFSNYLFATTKNFNNSKILSSLVNSSAKHWRVFFVS